MRSTLSVGLCLILGCSLLFTPAHAEEEDEPIAVGEWAKTAESGLSISQSSYSSNWNGGDRGSVVWNLFFNGSLEGQPKTKFNWLNQARLAYGQTLQQVDGGDGSLDWSRPFKSTDRIDLETIGRFTLGGYVDPFLSARLESQFKDATDPFGRTLLFNPLQFKQTAGIAKQIFNEENKSLLSRLGLTLRENVRRSFVAGDPSDDATESSSSVDGGIEFLNDYKARILDDQVAWTSKLGFYQPLFYSGKDALDMLSDAQLIASGVEVDTGNFTTTMDIDWENVFTTQITKYISVNLYVRWLYDKYDNSVKPTLNDTEDGLANGAAVAAAVRKAGQFKQTLGVGVTYRFF